MYFFYSEVHANALRKAKCGIPTIVSLMTTQADQDVKTAALNALITLSSSSGTFLPLFSLP